MYDSCYTSNLGLVGYRCRCKNIDGTECQRVVRTYRGISMHCKRVHGLVAQMKLFNSTPDYEKEKKDGEKRKTIRELKPLRDAKRAAKQRLFEEDCERELFDAGIET